jgi:hypothetical protein
MNKPLRRRYRIVICLDAVNHLNDGGRRMFLKNLASLESRQISIEGKLRRKNKANTLINPSAAHRAARFARPFETPNSSRTAVNDCKSPSIDWGDMRFATVRCAKKWIYLSERVRERGTRRME